LPKDNPELASQVLKLGVRLFLHTLAGFRVKSEAIKEVRQLESQIVKLSEEKQILEELIKTQKTMIADFSSKNSMLDYKRLVIEELHAEKERDIAKFNLLETEREKARGWRGGRMLMRNDKKR
jgi:vacuolar-type H+-ATPase subunit I/STV1